MARNTETTKQPHGWGVIESALQSGNTRDRVALYGLAALLLLQIGLIGWVYWPRALSSSSSVPLFGDLRADEVVSLSITDDKGERIHLTKSAEDWWVLLAVADQEGSTSPRVCGLDGATPQQSGVVADAPFNKDASASCFPASSGKVESLLGAITELTTGRLVANNETSYARLRVADDKFVRRLEFRLDDDTSHTLYIGSAPRARATHIRNGDHKNVYLAANLSGADADVAKRNWIDTLYFQAPEADIRSLRLANANGDFEFTQDESAVWSMTGLSEEEEFNDNNLISMLPFLTNLNMVEPLGRRELAEYGLNQPSAVLTLTTADAEGESQTHTLTIGAKAAQGNNYVVKSSDSPYYALISGYTAERFIDRGRNDFLKAPHAEQPAPGSE